MKRHPGTKALEGQGVGFPTVPACHTAMLFGHSTVTKASLGPAFPGRAPPKEGPLPHKDEMFPFSWKPSLLRANWVLEPQTEKGTRVWESPQGLHIRLFPL